MIQPIRWPQNNRRQMLNPFMSTSGTRPLTMTFHTSSFASLQGEQKEAVELLRDIAKSPDPDIEILYTEPGALPQLQIGRLNPITNQIPLLVDTQDGRQISATIFTANIWSLLAADLVSQPRGNQTHPDVIAMHGELLIARAHCALERDIMVTASPSLLTHKAKPFIQEANLLTPVQAAQLVGLLLRSRNFYYTHMSRAMYYWVLTRHLLPSSWRFLGACVQAGKLRKDNIQDLATGAILRADRSLQALDAIGEQFYKPQSENTAGWILYHFDYLTLLLSGAIDALARVARRTYRLACRDKDAGFHRVEFNNALKNKGARALYGIVSRQDFQHLLILVHEPRNTIHEAALSAMEVQTAGRPSDTFLHVPNHMAANLWESAERLGGAYRWGLVKDVVGTRMEPYSYATALMAECFRRIDEVAATTEVERLFPDPSQIPALPSAPPTNHHFYAQALRERLALLGSPMLVS